MTLSSNQLVDTLGLGAFWSEASSEINARIQSAISAFNGGGEFLTLSDVQDLGYISSGALSGYVQSDALSNYRTETQIKSLISSSISSFLSSTAINSLIADAGGSFVKFYSSTFDLSYDHKVPFTIISSRATLFSVIASRSIIHEVNDSMSYWRFYNTSVSFRSLKVLYG